jgi:hypothetical protein
MPRSARWVAPGAAHHVTRRGTNRQILFSRGRDRRVYLDQPTRKASAEGLRIPAYCLMNNPNRTAKRGWRASAARRMRATLWEQTISPHA